LEVIWYSSLGLAQGGHCLPLPYQIELPYKIHLGLVFGLFSLLFVWVVFGFCLFLGVGDQTLGLMHARQVLALPLTGTPDLLKVLFLCTDIAD
jgi:hypothetical protein